MVAKFHSELAVLEAGRSIPSTRCPRSYLGSTLLREEYGLSRRRRRGRRPFLSQRRVAVLRRLNPGEHQRR